MSEAEGRAFRLEITSDCPRCPTCGSLGLLSALVPHAIDNAAGDHVPGAGVAVLCASCDINDADAGPLIAFFTVHGTITGEIVTEAAHLIGAWAASARPKKCDSAQLEDEYQQWLQGRL